MKIDKISYLFVLIVFLGWGTSVFFDKLATNRLGGRSIIPVIVSIVFGLIPLFFFYFFSKSLNFDQKGILWLFVATLLNAAGVIFYYLLFVRSEITWAVPVTALYPILPIFLAFFFLKESISTTRIIGIMLSLCAIVFLSL